jgi:septum site-determining protein MinC
LYTLTSIQILKSDLTNFASQLEDKIKQAPKFFQNAPIVLDCQKLPKNDELDIARMLEVIRAAQLHPVAIRGGSPALQQAAILCQLALLPESKVEAPRRSPPAQQTQPALASRPVEKVDAQGKEDLDTPTRLITLPVRSGQQIYARGADLLVLAPVSHGAELLADGHIHVYAPLRGRALAGISGDKTARIFCQSLEAELVSIAGQYRLSEDLKDGPLWKTPVQIALDERTLQVTPLCANK